MRYLLLIPALIILLGCQRKTVERTQYFPRLAQTPDAMPAKEKVWVFLLAGQSKMAGRGQVEPKDTVIDHRIFSLNKMGQMVQAKEPLHYYEPNLTGLDCGMSFAKNLLTKLPADASILLLPTAVGGSAIEQWLEDAVHRDVKLLSNFKEKVAIGQQYGQIKGVLWHQGESNANDKGIPLHQERLKQLFTTFRTITGNEELPILIGELGAYSENKANWSAINEILRAYAAGDPNAVVISTADLKDKGDRVHFDSKGQREIGRRFAEAYVKGWMR